MSRPRGIIPALRSLVVPALLAQQPALTIGGAVAARKATGDRLRRLRGTS